MEIILKEDILNLGYKNDLVTVKPGYARNFLIPQGKALVANTSNKKVRDENIRQAAHKAAKMKQDAQDLAVRIGETSFLIKAKIGETGKIFGKVTNIQLADAMAEKGFTIDRRKVVIAEEIKALGKFTATVDLHKEVKHTVNFEVVEA